MVTLPPVPSSTDTRLGTVSPADQLRLEAVGKGAPVGKTVKKPAVDESTAVTLRIAAVAFTGTLLVPPTTRLTLAPGPSGPPLSLVSSTRTGVIAVYTPGGAGGYVNSSTELTGLVPPAFVTVTSTTPNPDGLVALIWVGPTTVNVVAVPPNLTVVAPV